MHEGKGRLLMLASVLAVALAGCCGNDQPLGIREGGGGGPATVPLGTASTFVVLAGSTVTNTGATIVTGDLGVSPGAAVTGFPPGIVNGTIHAADPAAAQAKADLTVAFNDAAGRTTGVIAVSGDLTGLTLAPGLYKSTSSLAITGTLTLNALGDANASFIIQMASTLTTGPGSKIILSGGARASNIIWQVGTSATLGTNSVFKGIILADQAITVNTGAKVDGRVLARIAAVTLDTNAITAP
jgi:ice-binding like protein